MNLRIKNHPGKQNWMPAQPGCQPASQTAASQPASQPAGRPASQPASLDFSLPVGTPGNQIKSDSPIYIYICVCVQRHLKTFYCKMAPKRKKSAPGRAQSFKGPNAILEASISPHWESKEWLDFGVDRNIKGMNQARLEKYGDMGKDLKTTCGTPKQVQF